MAAKRPARPSLLLGAAHLAAVWSLAFLQPMLSLLGDNPDFFVARGNSTGQILIYAFALAFVPPLIALAIEALAKLINENLRWIIHLVLMTVFTGAFFLTLIKKWVEWPAGIQIAASLLLAAACVFAYAGWKFPRSFMDLLTPAPLIILAFFIFFSSTSKLILPREEPNAIDIAITKPVPVVMVIFDELPLGSLMTPEGNVDPTRYPNFADLASSSTWYKNDTAAAAYTPLAVPALLSGRTPSQSDLPIAADHPHNLLTLLGKSYRLQVKEAATQLCTEDLCPDTDTSTGEEGLGDLFSDLRVVSEYLLLPDSLHKNLPDISSSFGGFTKTTPESTDEGLEELGTTGATGPTGETGATTPVRTGQGSARGLGRVFAAENVEDEIDRVKDFDSNIDGGVTRALNLIHIEKPHYPWRHIPTGQRYSNLTSEWVGLLPNDGPWEAPPRIVDIGLQRHLLEVGYTDTLLGLITDRLKETGLWDKALVVVTADHGGAFKSRVPRRAPTPENMGQIASVPLFIKSPGQSRPETVDEHTCATQLLPRMADILGIDYPWETEECPPDSVRVLSAPTGEATVPLKTMVKQRDAFVRHINSVFKTGEGWGPTYTFGPLNQIVGKPLKSFNVKDPYKRERAFPERPNLVNLYDPDSPVLPALLQRGVMQQIDQNKVIAIAINGKVVTTGWTFKDGTGKGPGYSILLPPDSLRKGRNDMQIFLVKDAGKTLQRIFPGTLRTSSEAKPGGNQLDGSNGT